MWYIEPAIVLEGNTDARFVASLVQRELESIVFGRATGGFEIADLFQTAVWNGLPEPDVAATSIEQFREFTICFVHRDADARDDRRAREWAQDVVMNVENAEPTLCFVIPIRVSESWMFSDGDALRRVLGVSWPDEELGVPANPADVEKIDDPKSRIRHLERSVSGPSIDVYARLGQAIDLEVINRVPSFAQLSLDIIAALETEGIID